MKKIILLSVVILFSLTLVSCTATEGSAYLAEDVIGSVPPDSEIWNELTDMLGMLTVDSSVVPEFDSMKESVRYFRDSVLNYMCCKSYRKYAGNSTLLEEINEKNPELDVIAAISAAEFEAELYRAFGGGIKINHRSTELFTYLEDSEVYVPVTAPIEGGVDLKLLSVDETENTYRIEFSCSTDTHESSYFAMLIKREDGTFYFSLLVKE